MKKIIRDQKFMDTDNWEDIKRGWIHEAVVPFTAERPLDFFIEDSSDTSKGEIKSGLGEFRPGKVHKAVFELKQRKVLILSNDDLCKDTSIFDVTVAPIYGIYEDDKAQEWYLHLVNGTHPTFAYLPEEVTGKECLVDLTNIISISKNMLLVDKVDMNDRMEIVEKVIGSCLSLGLYKKDELSKEEIG